MSFPAFSSHSTVLFYLCFVCLSLIIFFLSLSLQCTIHSFLILSVAISVVCVYRESNCTDLKIEIENKVQSLVTDHKAKVSQTITPYGILTSIVALLRPLGQNLDPHCMMSLSPMRR